MARKATGGSLAAEVMKRVNDQMRSNVLTLATDDKFRLKRAATGMLTIDRITGGGFARGRHVELYGDWSAGKSLVVYHALAAAQDRGEVCAIVDAERVFDQAWFRSLGGQPKKLIAFRPTTAEQLAAVLQLFVQNDEEVRGVDIVGIDSVATLLPREELEKDIEEGDDRVASLARMMSRLMRRVTSQNEQTLFIWTNQWRDKIGRIPGLKSTPGGLSLGFYASTRIEMLRVDKETEKRQVPQKGGMVERKKVIGQWVKVRTVKDKTTNPEHEGMFMFDIENKRVDVARELIDLGMQDGIIERRGNTYAVLMGEDDELHFHGIRKATTAINEDEELRDWLVTCVEERTAELGGLE